MSRFLSRRHSGLKPYVPGEQPTGQNYIKLNTNESPYPPSPKVLERLDRAQLERLRLYPDPEGRALRAKVAAAYGVRPENVFLANGSDEALALIFMAFFDEGTPAAFPDITYGFYPVYCDLFHIPYTAIPVREDFAIDAAGYCGLGRNIVLANPNAPTGLPLAPGEIEQIVRTNPENLVVVDEAYIDFGGQSVVPLIHRYDNLLVVHTCSKSRSLAGARLGFVFGDKELISDIDLMRYSLNSYNVSRLALALGEAAVEDEDYYREMRRKIVETRERATISLRALGFEATDSRANFIFARHPGFKGGELYRALKDMGILVRHFDRERISDYLRITVGTDEQMDLLCRALEKIISGGNMRARR